VSVCTTVSMRVVCSNGIDVTDVQIRTIYCAGEALVCHTDRQILFLLELGCFS